MQVACSLGLNGDAARLLSTEFPGGLGDAGALPDNLWLNNIPASKEARSHLGDAVCDAVVQAILEEAPTLQVTVKPPELGPAWQSSRCSYGDNVASMALKFDFPTGSTPRWTLIE